MGEFALNSLVHKRLQELNTKHNLGLHIWAQKTAPVTMPVTRFHSSQVDLCLYKVTDGNIHALIIPLEMDDDISDGTELSGIVAEMQLDGVFSSKLWQILAGMVQTAGTLVGQTLASGQLVKKVVIAGVVPCYKSKHSRALKLSLDFQNCAYELLISSGSAPIQESFARVITFTFTN